MGRISYEFTMTVISPLYVLDLEYFLLVICETPIKYGSKGMVLYYEVWYTVVDWSHLYLMPCLALCLNLWPGDLAVGLCGGHVKGDADGDGDGDGDGVGDGVGDGDVDGVKHSTPLLYHSSKVWGLVERRLDL